MPTLKEIIRESRLDGVVQKDFPSLEVTAECEAPRAVAPNTLEDLNRLYRAMDFPTIEERMLGDNSVLIDVLNNLGIEYDKYGVSLSQELEGVRERQELVSSCNEYERECDVLEVELANLKQEYDRMCEYSKYDVEGLEARLNKLRRLFSDMEYERLHSDLINRTLMFLSKGTPVDEDVVSALGYVRETREYLNIVEKAAIVDEITSIPDSCEKSIFERLVSKDSVALDDLERMLGLDRATVLKTVYGLLSKNAIVFNRSSDTISLRR